METLITNLINLPVYSDKGIYIGKVRNIRLDVEKGVIDALCLGETNKFIIKDQVNIAFPYKWIQAIGDIIVLKFFPERIVAKKEELETARETI
ncbi:MAG TPA: photosystem reaction center subunit H [Thermoplasmata archaeon]|nr:photosystem reaction center subunit H [Thermoplasmata archaeon]